MMQRHEVIRKIMQQYAEKTPITKRGITLLYDRAASRGYNSLLIFIGLKTVICKNYLREEYMPPNNDPMMENLDERRYIEDWEFREIMKGVLYNGKAEREHEPCN